MSRPHLAASFACPDLPSRVLRQNDPSSALGDPGPSERREGGSRRWSKLITPVSPPMFNFAHLVLIFSPDFSPDFLAPGR